MLLTLQSVLPTLFVLLLGCSRPLPAEEAPIGSPTEPAADAARPSPGPADVQEPAAESAPPGFDHEHALFTEVLAQFVAGDSVDYAALKKDRKKLDRYVAALEAVKPAELAKWKREERYAFWINVYNAHVLKLIIDNYPVKSIKDIGSLVKRVWNKEFIDLEGFHPEGKKDLLSLDDVEHKILRPRFKDARVHAAVNCASVSCSPLRAEAFVAARLDAQLDEQVRAWLADPQRNRFDKERRTLHLSKIFDWFEADFRRDGGSVVGWIARFAPAAEKAWISTGDTPKVRHLSYSWKLNDAPAK
ncbi:MAG: DUF547 domain-containing protein [bacterium]|nr:DUF547 domain-containing protein [bacterium]